MSDELELPPPTAFERFLSLSVFGAIIFSGAPSTTLIPLALTQALTHRFRREEMLKRLHLMIPWARFSAQVLCQMKLHVKGKQNLPKPSRGHLYVSNHQSYVDILVLMDALDTVAFLSKDLVRRFPVIGRSAYCGGTVYISRKNRGDRQRALDETLRMCHQSTAVVVFPEGTRSSTGQLREKIYPRAMLEAWRHGLRIVPIGLDGTGNVFPKSMDRINFGRHVVVNIGRSLDPDESTDAEAYAETCWARVAELHAEAQQQRLALE